MRYILLVTSLGLCTVGCLHRHNIQTAPKTLVGKSATVEFNNGDKQRAVAVSTPSGLVWKTDDGRQHTATSVQSVTYVNHASGAFVGLLSGALLGATIGAISGHSKGDDPECSGCILRFTAGDKAKLGSVAMGLVGVMVGTISGAVVGSRSVYHHKSQENLVPRLSAQPVSGGASATATWSF